MSLTQSYTFTGNGNWSLDATSGFATGGGIIDVAVPVGSQIDEAFLYATTFGGTSGSATLSRGENIETVTSTGFVSLGTDQGFLTAYRADVTGFIDKVVGSGAQNPFHFSVSNITGAVVDGYALAVIYANPNEAYRTITFFDGFSASTGDTFSLQLSQPINFLQQGFQVLLSLGIGFGYQELGDPRGEYSQYSSVTVNGRTLTQSAGGSDDGYSANGGLITIGGLGDNANNPGPNHPTFSLLGPQYDDELYNLALGDPLGEFTDPSPFLANGTTTISVDTANPSHDDNIFFADCRGHRIRRYRRKWHA